MKAGNTLRTFAVFMAIIICAAAFPFPAFAANGRATTIETLMAQDLKDLGLFKGVSDTEFDLGRPPTRVEALVMLIRLLGKEAEALDGEWTHPFADIAEGAPWADQYVGFAYETGLTNGVSEDQFGLSDATAAMYLTFVLRSLGYSDAGGEDFTWDDPYGLARSTGILPGIVKLDSFWRADVVTVSYAALSTALKDSTETLADKLIAEEVFSTMDYVNHYNFDLLDIIGDDVKAESVHYEWEWGGWDWTYDLVIPFAAVEEYRSYTRVVDAYYSNYSDYVYDESDDDYILELAEAFENAVTKEGLEEDDAVYFAISFVQSLKYTPDDIGLGYDYPKYPLETLYDQGGDCEDSSILLVSMLIAMGYGCCLIRFDDHMAVGILGSDDLSGYYFTEEDRKYYYIETTNTGWELGEMPEDYIYREANIWTF